MCGRGRLAAWVLCGDLGTPLAAPLCPQEGSKGHWFTLVKCTALHNCTALHWSGFTVHQCTHFTALHCIPVHPLHCTALHRQLRNQSWPQSPVGSGTPGCPQPSLHCAVHSSEVKWQYGQYGGGGGGAGGGQLHLVGAQLDHVLHTGARLEEPWQTGSCMLAS